MKKLIILLLTLTMFSCYDSQSKLNTRKAIQWIEKANKPIRCIIRASYLGRENSYTLIDAKGKIYNASFVQLVLPDTLKL